MYYQNYEDYIRDVLGYNSYNNTKDNNYQIDQIATTNTNTNDYLLNMYPDTYKKIQPLVEEVCNKRVEIISQELLENMTSFVCDKLEINNNDNDNNRSSNDTIKTNINQTNKISNRGYIRNEPLKNDINNKLEDRHSRSVNPFLRDLVKILILDRLIGINRPNRPPQPPPKRPSCPNCHPPFRPDRPPIYREEF